MDANIQQIYRQTILPLSEQEQLKLAALIINKISSKPNGDKKPMPENTEVEHPLSVIGRIKVDFDADDLAERHDFYAHGKLEE